MSFWRVAGRVAAVLGVVAVPTMPDRPPVAGAASRAVVADLPPGATVFVAVAPCRVADSRNGTGVAHLDASTVRIPVAGRCGVPADATAVAVTFTATATSAAGYLSAYPSGAGRPNSSNLNWPGAGATRANAAITRLGAGAVDVFVSAAADVVVDVTGAFVPVAEPPAAGRFVPLEARVLDTRPTSTPIAAGGSFGLALPPSIPADATAVAINLTLVEAQGWGYASVAPSDASAPSTSTVNVDGAGQTRAAAAIVGVGPSGLVVHTSVAAHVVVDIQGWFTGASAAPDAAGLFVPVAPTRLVDSRDARPVRRDLTVTVDVPRAAAVAVNWTLAGADAPAYLWTGGAVDSTPRAATTSAVNAAPGEGDVANLQLAAVGGARVDGVAVTGLSARVSTPVHVIGDVNGWFTDDAADPAATASCTRVNVIGDSLLYAAGPWVQPALADLAERHGFAHAVDAKSSRVIPDQADPRMSGAMTARRMREEHGEADCWVIELGANGTYWITHPGPYGTTGTDTAENYVSMMYDAISPNARVVWVNLAKQPMTPSARTFNDVLAAEDARSALFEVADWSAVAGAHPEWFIDGLHVDAAGAEALADLIVTSVLPR